VVKDEAHFISTAIDSADPATERCNQIIHRFKQHVGQNGPFQMSPQTFDKIQAGTVRRQPEYLNERPIGMQPFPNCPRVVKSSVVTDQPDFATRIPD